MFQTNRQHLIQATYEPELVDDLGVPSYKRSKQREGDAHEETNGSDTEEEKQSKNCEGQMEMEAPYQHQPYHRISSGVCKKVMLNL